jgi:hypothetical protein
LITPVSINENFFVQDIKELFDTLKKTKVLYKYDVKFTVRPKNKDNKVTKEKSENVKEIDLQ